MKLVIILSVCLCLASSAPVSDDDDQITVTEDFFPDQFVVYTGEHDIVKLVVPLNNINFDDGESGEETDILVFFVEADIKDDGTKEDKGLFVLKEKNATKLLENGRDIAASNDDTKQVFLGAKDGLYVYNAEKNTADKYGSVTDSIIALAKLNSSDALYILTEDKKLFKVTDDGNKKVPIDEVQNAEQIVLDYSDNLYYVGADKQPYVINAGGVKKIEGLPENPTKIDLIKPPFIIDDGIPVVIDKKSYVIYANGTSELSDFVMEVKPTAYAMEAALIQYYGYNKKIYEYNILILLLEGILEELSNYLNSNKKFIENLGGQPKSGMHA